MNEILDLLIQLRDTINSHLLFSLGILLVGGYVFGKLAEKVKLPSITGYILAGLVLGPILGLVPNFEEVESFAEVELIEEVGEIEQNETDETTTDEGGETEHQEDDKEHTEDGEGESNGHGGGHSSHSNPLANVTEVALGLIALTIGGEFSLHKLKKTGLAVVIMTLTQLLLSFGFVSLFLIVFGFDWVFSLILGAIASATAPAATVAIIQSLNIKGPFVDYLYGIVALDDAGAVILFGIIFSIGTSIVGSASGETVSTLSIILSSVLEVVFSVLLGFILGVILHLIISKGSRKNITINERLIISLSILFLSTAMAKSLHLSPLLTNMILGGTLINMSKRNEKIFSILSPLAPPIYASFFAIAGTELDIMVFSNLQILMFGIIFVLARAIGKYGGVFLGAFIMKAEKKTRNYLGFCMLPQAGVAIGLSLILQSHPVMMGNESASQVVSIVLFSVFINEIIGPPISKFAVIRGSGISPEDVKGDISH